MKFKRYAVYFTPTETPMAEIGASWLGWNNVAGEYCDGSRVGGDWDGGEARGQHEVVKSPHRYGFHATIMAPFALAENFSVDAMIEQFQTLCLSLKAAQIDGLRVERLGRFLALVPVGDVREIIELAESVVKKLNNLRAPQSYDEVARRTPKNATDRQKELIAHYGYRHVLEDFKFHMTLTSRVPNSELFDVNHQLTDRFSSIASRIFLMSTLSLMGEDMNGYFHKIDISTLEI